MGNQEDAGAMTLAGATNTAVARPLTFNEIILNPQAFQALDAVATLMASGVVSVPESLRGKKADCFALAMKAASANISVWDFASKAFVLNGKIGYEAQLIVAMEMASGYIDDNGFDIEYFGPWEKVNGKIKVEVNADGKRYNKPGWTPEDEVGCGVKVSARVRATGKVKEYSLLLTQCTTRNSTNWANNPQLQCTYQAQKQWTRVHNPGSSLGMYTRDELEEIDGGPKPVEAKVKSLFGGNGEPAAGAPEKGQEVLNTQPEAEPAVVLPPETPDAFGAFIDKVGREDALAYLVSIGWAEADKGVESVTKPRRDAILLKQKFFKEKTAAHKAQAANPNTSETSGSAE